MKNKYNRSTVVLLALLMALSSISSVWAQSVSLVGEKNRHHEDLLSGLSVKNSQLLRSDIKKPVGNISRTSAASNSQLKKFVQFSVLENALPEYVSNDGGCSSSCSNSCSNSCSSHMSCCTISLIHKSVVFTFEGIRQGYTSNYVERKTHLILPVDIKPPRFVS